MEAHVAVHIREVADRRALVTPVPFTDLAYEAASVESALAALRPALRDRIAALEPIDRLPFAEPPEAELHSVPTEVAVGGKGGERVALSVAAVYVRRSAGGKQLLVAYVPAVPGIELVGTGDDVARLTQRVAKAVAGRLRSWSLTHVLNADEPVGARLEMLTVAIDEAGGEWYGDTGPPDAEQSRGILEELGLDLARADGGRIDGRDELVERVLETIAAPGRSSVLLVGTPDVGKTALIHEVGRRLATGEVPSPLAGRGLWRLTANELIAGAQYTGQWQDRVRRLVDQARQTNALVAMGDPVGIIDAGRWAKSDNSVARYLKPYIEGGEVTLICDCTPDQLAAAQRHEPSFVGAFHRIDVPEPDRAETRTILATVAARLAEQESLEITPDALDATVALAERFEPYRGYPGKAIRILEDAAGEREEGTAKLDRAAVTASFARRSGMPLELLSDDVPLQTGGVREYFESAVLGQPGATETVADLIVVFKAGLSDPGKPLASLFFVGPTGVGKTELAKALAEFLFGSRQRLVRFDMGEYQTADAVERLIGTAWGRQEGELTRRVREQPFCVVLLDELEKAHRSVFDALLAAIGEGRLTDAAGRVADFRNAIVIMTSNLGARTGSGSLGFASNGATGDAAQQRYVEAAEKFFRPEFFNRLDRVVVFHSLTAPVVRRIARRELDRLLLREGIVRRQLLVEVDDAVVDAVASAGFHPRYGARPLQREIERAVIQPLARIVVDRRLGKNELVRIHLKDGRVAVDVQRIRAPQPEPARGARAAQRPDAPFAKWERSALEFSEQLADDDAASFADEVRAELSRLVERSNAAGFWDDPARARTSLQRIYTLEQVLAGFDALRDRAAGLAEMAKRVRQARERGRLAEISGALGEMDDRLVVVRLELAAAAVGAERDAAVVRVVPIGPAAGPWAEQLLGMYAAWAERTGREIVADGPLGARIEGPATLDMLAAESGLHRRVLIEQAEELARVSVTAPGEPAVESEDPGLVVRVYEQGKRRVVRDPRTGVRSSRVEAVLEEGRIEPFLIACLRHSAPRQ